MMQMGVLPHLIGEMTQVMPEDPTPPSQGIDARSAKEAVAGSGCRVVLGLDGRDARPHTTLKG